MKQTNRAIPRRNALTGMQRRKLLADAAAFLALVILVFLIDLPLIAMAGTALKRQEIAMASTSLLPGAGEWSLQSFSDVFVKADFGVYILNSALVSVISTLCCVAISCTAGFALSRFRGKFFAGFSILLLMLQMFPGMLLLIPMFTLYTKLNLINTRFSVILSYTALNLAFNMMMVRGFFDSIPRALDEAAKVDGCTVFQAYLRIILPISLPGVATVAIFTFLNAWNEFTFANLMLRDREIQTLTLGLTKFVQQSTTNWPLLMAASTIATVPALFFLVFAQKYLIQGLTAGAVKG